MPGGASIGCSCACCRLLCFLPSLFVPSTCRAHNAPHLPPHACLQDANLAPSSQLLLVDSVMLLKDALEETLGTATPLPNWAAAYGYTPNRSIFFPAEPAELGLHSALSDMDALVEPTAAQASPLILAESARAPARRRLSQQQPPLPAGDAPGLKIEHGVDAYEDNYLYR